MARPPVADPLAGLDEARLERLARVAGHLLGGRPLRSGGALPHPRAAAAGLEFLEHRPLMPGDDPRHVDWRASARHRTALVRRYRDERAGEWILCLDRSASMGAAPGVWALAATLTAALAYVLLALEHRVGLATFSSTIDALHPPGRGRATYLGLRRALADALPRGSGGGSRLEACLPLFERGREAAVIGDFLRPDAMAAPLSRLAGRCRAVHVLQVQGPVLLAGDHGPLSLEDAESGQRLDVGAAPELAAAVEERGRSHARALAAHCRSRRIRYTACAVGDDWEQALLSHLLGNAGQAQGPAPPLRGPAAAVQTPSEAGGA